MTVKGTLLSARERLALVARALRVGDPLAALNGLTGLDGPHATALRGIALAQLGEFSEARRLLERAKRAFARSGGAVDHARTLAALAELVAAARELRPAITALGEVADRLDHLGDFRNASWSRLVLARLLLLDGRSDQADDLIDTVARSTARRDAVLALTIDLARAEMAMRLIQASKAKRALHRARRLVKIADNEFLKAEMGRLQVALDRPLARLQHSAKTLTLSDLETLYREPAVVDGLGRRLLVNSRRVGLQRRPVLFALLLELARVWPSAASAEVLISAVFATQKPNESHHARLRVELSRLRRLISPELRLVADGGGWRLQARRDVPVLLIHPLDDSASAALRALLSDGAAWSTRNLAEALGRSERTIQRALRSLSDSGSIRAIGSGRGRRWALESPGGITTQMLLLGLYQPN